MSTCNVRKQYSRKYQQSQLKTLLKSARCLIALARISAIWRRKRASAALKSWRRWRCKAQLENSAWLRAGSSTCLIGGSGSCASRKRPRWRVALHIALHSKIENEIARRLAKARKK